MRSRLRCRATAFVFEAAPEKLPLKQRIFAELEALAAPDDDPVASNSSAFPSTEIGRHLRPSRARPRHPFLGSAASRARWSRSCRERVDERRRRAADHGAVARRRQNTGACPARRAGLRRQPFSACDEAPEAIALRRRFATASATPRPIDTVVVHPAELWRPHRRARPDGAIRSQVRYQSPERSDIAEVLYADLDRTPGPHAYLRETVAAGKLGMKSGEGLRKWPPGEADAVRDRFAFPRRAGQSAKQGAAEGPGLSVARHPELSRRLRRVQMSPPMERRGQRVRRCIISLTVPRSSGRKILAGSGGVCAGSSGLATHTLVASTDGSAA